MVDGVSKNDGNQYMLVLASSNVAHDYQESAGRQSARASLPTRVANRMLYSNAVMLVRGRRPDGVSNISLLYSIDILMLCCQKPPFPLVASRLSK